jgi:hypothetical protein
MLFLLDGEILCFTPPLEGGRGEEKLKGRGKKIDMGRNIIKLN